MDLTYYAVGDFTFGLDNYYFKKLAEPYTDFELPTGNICEFEGLTISCRILQDPPNNDNFLKVPTRKMPIATFEKRGVFFMIFYPPRNSRHSSDSDSFWFARIVKKSVILYIPRADLLSSCFGGRFARSQALPRLCSYYLKGQPCFLVHGAHVIGPSGAMLLTGDSGVGKSTLAKIFRDRGGKVASDDLVLIQAKEDGFYISGTPWNFTNPSTSMNITSKLSHILFLTHGFDNIFHELSVEEALLLFIRQIHTFTNANTKQDDIERFLFAKKLLSETLFHSFSFVPDASAWRVINAKLSTQEINF